MLHREIVRYDHERVGWRRERNRQGERDLARTFAIRTLAASSMSGSPCEALVTWLRRFAVFHHSKHPIAAELLRHTDVTDPVFGNSRYRILLAGKPLLVTGQQVHGVRSNFPLEQVLDLLFASPRCHAGLERSNANGGLDRPPESATLWYPLTALCELNDARPTK